MSKKIFETFGLDRLLRNSSGVPIGRVVLIGDFKPGPKIQVAVMEVFDSNNIKAIGEFYVNGKPYIVPSDLPDVRFSIYKNKVMVNNFYLVECS